MALINCPVCGKSVSDKGKDCIYCGSLLSAGGQNSLNEEIACPECGTYMHKDKERCDVCGCPLHEEVVEKGKKKKEKKPKKEKVKKEKPPKKELSQKEILEKEKKVFNVCAIVALVMSELSLAAAIVLPLIDIISTVNYNASGYGYNYVYVSEEYIIFSLVISLVCRFGFMVARNKFKKKAMKAEREFEKCIEEEKTEIVE